MKKQLILFLILSFFLYFPLLSDIKNPDKPLKSDWDLRAESQWQISKYGKKNMAAANFGCIADDGTICLYDFKHGAHYVISSDGTFKAEFGKKGEGPGEVRFPHRYFSVKDTFIIYDLPKLHYFLLDGTFVKSLPIGSRFDPPELFINKNEYISHKQQNAGGVFSHVNLAESKQNLIKKILPYETGVSESSQRGKMTVIMPGLCPKLGTAFDTKNKRLYYAISDTYAIHVIDMAGHIIEGFSLDREKIKFTKKMLNRVSLGERRMLKSWFKKIIGKFPYLTYFDKIQVENGLLLVYVIYFGDSWEEQQIDIFSLDGKYLCRTFFKPADGDIIVDEVLIKNGYLYALLEDGDGDRKLAKYKITLPAN